MEKNALGAALRALFPLLESQGFGDNRSKTLQFFMPKGDVLIAF